MNVKPEAVVTAEEIFRIYEQVAKYDIHYSTVRSAISTFLAVAVLACDAWIVATTWNLDLTEVPMRLVASCLLGPLTLAVISVFLSAYFQRLTICCQKIQENLEAQLVALRTGKEDGNFWNGNLAVLFRQGIGLLTRNNAIRLRPCWADVPQRCLFLFTILQLSVSLLYWSPVLAR